MKLKLFYGTPLPVEQGVSITIKSMKKLTALFLLLALVLTMSMSVFAESQDIEYLTEIIDTEIDLSNVSPAAQTSGITNNAVYKIKNVNSGKYLNVHYGNDANGTNVYQWTDDGSDEQQFKVVYSASTDSYKLYAMCSSSGANRVLDVVRNGAELTSGQNVDIWTPIDDTAQELKIISLGSSKYRIAMNANQNLCFTAYGTSNGSSSGTTSTSTGNVFISTYTGATSQQWEFVLISTSAAAPTGWLDSVSSNGASGWAWRSDIPNTAITVHLYLINTYTDQQWVLGTTAGNYRADLYNAGYGNGYHGFGFSIDWDSYPAGVYNVYAYGIGADGNNPVLSGCPKQYSNNVTSNTDYVWPTVSKRITQLFTGIDGHRGIDIGAVTAGVAGDDIYCFADGYVTRSKELYSDSYGHVIYINHINPKPDISTYLQTRYAHMVDQPIPEKETTTVKGQVIGYMGTTGTSTGVHLHFETKIADSLTHMNVPHENSIDPLNYFTSSGEIKSQNTSSANSENNKLYVEYYLDINDFETEPDVVEYNRSIASE